MTHRHAISDADFDRVRHLLPGQPGQHGGVAADNRRFPADAVLWIARTGATWADLPERLGNSNDQWRRFDRWAAKGRWDPILAELRDPDLDVLILDSDGRRGPPPARRGGEKKWDGSGGQGEQALGRSRGRFGTEIHGSIDGLGAPVELLLTAAQESDIAQAEALLADHAPEVVIADKGYDKKGGTVRVIESRGAKGGDPGVGRAARPRHLDIHVYRERNLCERFWSTKQFRRFATRYEKKAVNYLAFVKVAAMMVMFAVTRTSWIPTSCPYDLGHNDRGVGRKSSPTIS